MSEARNKLIALADRIWNAYLSFNPGYAVMLGERDYVDQMEDVSLETENARLSKVKDFLSQLSRIDSAKLDLKWQISLGVIKHELTEFVAGLDARFVEWVAGMMGPQNTLSLLHPQMVLTDKRHADGMLKRIELHARYFNQLRERMRRGLQSGLINNRRNIGRTINSLEKYLATDILTDPLLGATLPQSMNESERIKWREHGASIVAKTVRPAVQSYVGFLKTEQLPVARPDDKFGVQWMSGGEEYYAKFLPLHTGTPGITAAEVHAIGKQEVSSLIEQYEELGPRAIGENKFSRIVTRLRTDKAMRYTDARQMVELSQKVVDRAFKEARDVFGIYPEAVCKVMEVPAHAAEDSPPAFYFAPPFDGSRPGIYFINTYKPEQKDMFECEALAFHEAVPGHHLERTIAAELKDVPQLQRIAGTTAFIEGWGLYAETLANEIGLYSDDVQQLGRLSSNIFRAARLVLDTGIHALGWSRKQAVDYFTAHVPITPVDIETEVDRYSSWPGQACAYKMGERKIFELRRSARKQLGDRFKLSEFHDQVMQDGGLTLGILETKIDAWIKRTANRPCGST